MQVSRSAF
jgi:hypothetical protein